MALRKHKLGLSRSDDDAGSANLHEPPNEPVIVDVEVCQPCVTIREEDLVAPFEMQVLLSWIDPRLVGFKGVLPDNLWYPHLMCHMKSNVILVHASIQLSDAQTGKVVQIQVFPSDALVDLRGGSELGSLDLRWFPFDTLCFAILISPDQGSNHVMLRFPKHSADKPSPLVTARYQTQREWDYTGVLAESCNLTSPLSGVTYTKVFLAITMRRNIGFYMLKGILPLFFTCLMGCTALAIDPHEDGALAARLQIHLTVLLTIIAIQWTVGAHLPHIPDITMFDTILYCAISFATFQAFVACGVNVMLRREADDGLVVKVDLIGTIVVIGLGLGVVSCVLGVAVWHDRRGREKHFAEAMLASFIKCSPGHPEVQDPVYFYPVGADGLTGQGKLLELPRKVKDQSHLAQRWSLLKNETLEEESRSGGWCWLHEQTSSDELSE